MFDDDEESYEKLKLHGEDPHRESEHLSPQEGPSAERSTKKRKPRQAKPKGAAKPKVATEPNGAPELRYLLLNKKAMTYEILPEEGLNTTGAKVLIDENFEIIKGIPMVPQIVFKKS